jgi:hypothetical protein
MERSEGVTATLARIMKLMGRSDGSLPRSIRHFEGSESRVVRSRKAPQLVPEIPVHPEVSPARAGLAR